LITGRVQRGCSSPGITLVLARVSWGCHRGGSRGRLTVLTLHLEITPTGRDRSVDVLNGQDDQGFLRTVLPMIGRLVVRRLCERLGGAILSTTIDPSC
jgi:hypothetical protein